MDNSGNLYIAGTRLGTVHTVSDIRDDLLLPIGQVKHTARYHEVDAIVQRVKPAKLVGHSLGGSVAKALSHEYSIPYEVYGTPAVAFGDDPHSHKTLFDPVAAFDFSAQVHSPTELNPHGYGYASAVDTGPTDMDDAPSERPVLDPEGMQLDTSAPASLDEPSYRTRRKDPRDQPQLRKKPKVTLDDEVYAITYKKSRDS